MPRRRDTRFIAFNDGNLDICRASGRKITDTIERDIRFGFRTVGYKRFYDAKVLSSQIDETVVIPYGRKVTTLDVCIIRKKQYRIIQVQRKFDASPPCLLLSLERIVPEYEDIRDGEN